MCYTAQLVCTSLSLQSAAATLAALKASEYYENTDTLRVPAWKKIEPASPIHSTRSPRSIMLLLLSTKKLSKSLVPVPRPGGMWRIQSMILIHRVARGTAGS